MPPGKKHEDAIFRRGFSFSFFMLFYLKKYASWGELDAALVTARSDEIVTLRARQPWHPLHPTRSSKIPEGKENTKMINE
jgi:hypothetical protein